MVTNSSALRMEKDVPLVIPEVNPDHIKLIECQSWTQAVGGFVVTNPNCSAIGLVIALAPLHHKFGIETSWSSLCKPSAAQDIPEWHRSTFSGNVIPYIAKEEEKMEEETRSCWANRMGPASSRPSSR